MVAIRGRCPRRNASRTAGLSWRNQLTSMAHLLGAPDPTASRAYLQLSGRAVDDLQDARRFGSDRGAAAGRNAMDMNARHPVSDLLDPGRDGRCPMPPRSPNLGCATGGRRSAIEPAEVRMAGDEGRGPLDDVLLRAVRGRRAARGPHGRRVRPGDGHGLGVPTFAWSTLGGDPGSVAWGALVGGLVASIAYVIGGVIGWFRPATWRASADRPDRRTDASGPIAGARPRTVWRYGPFLLGIPLQLPMMVGFGFGVYLRWFVDRRSPRRSPRPTATIRTGGWTT